jgi:predicted DNA-binding helix-hairpin-helix protein
VEEKMTTRKINGTAVEDSRKYPAINRRIEQLGQLNDRHTAALNRADRQALKELAIEYEAMECPRRAAEIRDQAKGIRKNRKVMGYASGASQSQVVTP